MESSPSAAKQLSPGATAECSEFLTRILNGPQGGIDLKSLSIVPGALSWVISIEALIVEFGGNLLDTLLCAIRGALFSTRVPRVTVETSEGHYAFDVSEEETELLKGREEIPLSVTLTKVVLSFLQKIKILIAVYNSTTDRSSLYYRRSTSRRTL